MGFQPEEPVHDKLDPPEDPREPADLPRQDDMLQGGADLDAGGVAPGQPAAGAPAALAIVAICVAVFFFSFGLQVIPQQYLLFSPGQGLVFPGIISHMFAHASLMHLMGNMLVLYFLGTVVERSYGTPRFLVLYFVSGLFAALAEGAVHPDGLLLGASGAIAGVMAAFVRHYPRAMLYLYAVLPIPAWLFMLLWLGYNLWGAAAGGLFNTAFTAHIGGFGAGLLVSLLLVRPASARAEL